MVRPRRSASTTSERKDGNDNIGGETTPKQGAAALRRSTREREQPQQLRMEVPGTSKGARSRRKGKGLPMGQGEAEGEPTKVGKASRKLDKAPPPTRTATPLMAEYRDGPAVLVHVVVNGKAFQPKNRKEGPTASAAAAETQFLPAREQQTTIFLGHDGNLYYCYVCSQPGDVVCCDGCPKVFHSNCIPKGSASRESLENDDDPWFCPDCMEKKTPAKTEGRSEGRNKRAIKHSCHECHQNRTDLSVEPCKVCGTYIHHPPCFRTQAAATSESESRSVIMCSSCRAEAALTEEELERMAEKKKKKKKRKLEIQHETTYNGETTPTKSEGPEQIMKPRAHQNSFDGSAQYVVDDEYPYIGENDEDPSIGSGQKRKRLPDDVGSPKTPSSEKKPKKKKKKKRKKDDEGTTGDDGAGSTDVAGSEIQSMESPLSSLGGLPTGPLQGPPTSATPAFHFYLAEMRPKVEKVLIKKHKSFNRLPKGNQRNALIAKEAATWWVKLSPYDQKKYIDESMRDYEARIIAWKEEKNIRAMLSGTPEADGEVPEASSGDTAIDEDMLRYEMHQRLYLATSVGSKPYKPEAGESHNRVLLDLLRDMRFHPLPMFSVSRTETDLTPEDVSKACVPYFDAHGPIATSVGDECLGCNRGWPHYCPVLQRRLPAVEARAKLQPPLSSLVATRVGLGLRPRLEHNESIDEDDKIDESADLLQWRETKESTDMQKQRFVPSGTLMDPSSRADDVVKFVEEVLAMKIPEPPRPDKPEQPAKEEVAAKKPVLARGTLPTRHKRPEGAPQEETPAESENIGYEYINKCGRCRTIIMTDLGCVQCRRAQLVINLSKKQPAVNADQKESKKESKKDIKKEANKELEQQERPLKVQTAMLSRLVTKDNIGEPQAEGDKLISEAILRERWTPCAVLPPRQVLAPSPSRRSTTSNKSEEDRAGKAPGQMPPEVVSSEVRAAVHQGKDERDKQKSDSERSPLQRNTERRPRNSKRVAAPPGSFDHEDTERQLAARQFKEEADKLNKQTLSIACSGILVGLLRRDPLLLFAQPVTAEGYAAVIKNPIDFRKIKSKVLSDSYQSLGEFSKDVKLLCQNAMIFNPPGSIYWKTAKELSDALVVMQRRANMWIGAIKNAHASFWRKSSSKKKSDAENPDSDGVKDAMDTSEGDPFEQLRQTWPDAVDMFKNSEWLRNRLNSDFTRTRENETAYYGSLAVRRAAVAAEECLAQYTDVGGTHSVVVKRSYIQDERLREIVDSKVAEVIDPVQLKEIATGREESIVRLMRKVQTRRLERRMGLENGCARCDGMGLDNDMKIVMNAEKRWGRPKKKGDGDDIRVAPSRLSLTTGLASARTLKRIGKRREQSSEEQADTINDVCVSLRGSRIHGWGLFAEQPFKKGDVVAEYVGECVSLAVADAREKSYQDMRIQDYQFRLDDSQIIDATVKGGLGRYINHNCNPNCKTKIVPGKVPNQHLRRVLIIARRDIEPREELSYDYQFPLELDLDARIPCNCQSEICRGFMNWDLPEKGANTGALRTQKRGANMRDRIRRLGRPLKK